MLLEHSIEETVATLDSCDRRAYRSLLKPLTGQFDQLIEEVLSPMWHFPRHPLLLARFGPLALLSGMRLAKSFFRGQRARTSAMLRARVKRVLVESVAFLFRDAQ